MTDLLEVMYREPDFALTVEDAAKVTPSNGERRTRFYSFEVARLD